MTIFRIPARPGQSKKEVEKKRFTLQLKGSSRIALGTATVLILSILLSLHLLPDKVSLQVGETSPTEILAHRTVRYVDSVETERLRQQAAARVDNLYDIVPRATSQAIETASNIFRVLRTARVGRQYPNIEAKSRYVRQNTNFDLSQNALAVLLAADDETFNQIETYTEQLVKQIMGREIRDDNDDVQQAQDEFRRRMKNFLGSSKYAAATADIGSDVIKPNRVFDQEQTDESRDRERMAVPEQYRQIFLGELVISSGERVTPEHIDKFMALGLSHPQVDYATVLCITLLTMCVVILAITYLARYHVRVYTTNKLLVLLSFIVVFCVLGLKLGGTMLGLNLSGLQFGYFATSWIATAGMLTAILLDAQIAVLMVAVLATTSGLAMNHELRWALSAMLSSLVAIYAVSDIRHRSDLVRAAVAVCAANLAMVWLIGQISGDAVSDLLVGSAWAVMGGLGSIMLFALGTTALEKPFGITTHNRLVELSDTHNPMLKRLLMEAPGTYSHSIFVGNIAATAADVIGADALAVRVGSYYHDIGKIKRPHFFVENQHVENAHDRLNPTLSALVIRSHIKDGMDLAREYKLPPLVCELMIQHHGTSLVRYFYSQAAGNAPNSATALEQQFRYEGTKPQSKEAALLMLADVAEAASRSLSKPTPGQIEDMVDGLISEKLTDGQLDESELTFKDISRIRDSFVRTLTSMLHARIEYPDLPGAEAKKLLGNGSPGKELPLGNGKSDKVDKGREELTSV